MKQWTPSKVICGDRSFWTGGMFREKSLTLYFWSSQHSSTGDISKCFQRWRRSLNLKKKKFFHRCLSCNSFPVIDNGMMILYVWWSKLYIVTTPWWILVKVFAVRPFSRPCRKSKKKISLNLSEANSKIQYLLLKETKCRLFCLKLNTWFCDI